jgi:ABC-type dipeptide/oligopeptide/nickel transport system permease component
MDEISTTLELILLGIAMVIIIAIIIGILK